ncbi:hypothetical protein PVL29_008148 [Vitis rotundifolia]|uniref:Phytosulfokine n=1 Tax=Vitis rotundifolia TaxID=103349 RepID=A0AA39A3Y4_VITRO|nr:putative phytosulfokines 6 isoform X2 [Vitis vinifera]XP_034687401.1 putative phytosulfokines 6 isoform X2 [Vitis riparia]KAJ9699419.1 hypothetical protein PVL29_008148 [Vitis rotundifolia]|eukprot:XP_010651731.1 PREDICTED: putative phytosulfokines 6 isoform X2 [Vitis vinifera]
MKQILHSSTLLLFLVFLIFSSSSKSSARLLITKQGEEGVKLKELINGVSLLEMEGNDSFELMGVEDCENGDEECLKRRIISEAHLDYIYTQHHKP